MLDQLCGCYAPPSHLFDLLWREVRDLWTGFQEEICKKKKEVVAWSCYQPPAAEILVSFLHSMSDPEMLENRGLGTGIDRTPWLLHGEDGRSKLHSQQITGIAGD